jgi:hypothetical protein
MGQEVVAIELLEGRQLPVLTGHGATTFGGTAAAGESKMRSRLSQRVVVRDLLTFLDIWREEMGSDSIMENKMRISEIVPRQATNKSLPSYQPHPSQL